MCPIFDGSILKGVHVMEMMILGLILFLGGHSIGMFAPDWRMRKIEQVGRNAYRGIYATLALIGITLIVKGHDNALESLTWGWTPPVFTKHISVLLMLFALIMLVSTYVPNNHIKAKLKHPMILSVKVWALAHFIANGEGANVILFGSFLIWAILNFRFARQRDRLALEATAKDAPIVDLPINTSFARTLTCLVLGLVIWVVMVAYLHNLLFGVYPIVIPGLMGPIPAAGAVVMPT